MAFDPLRAEVSQDQRARAISSSLFWMRLWGRWSLVSPRLWRGRRLERHPHGEWGVNPLIRAGEFRGLVGRSCASVGCASPSRAGGASKDKAVVAAGLRCEGIDAVFQSRRANTRRGVRTRLRRMRSSPVTVLSATIKRETVPTSEEAVILRWCLEARRRLGLRRCRRMTGGARGSRQEMFGGVRFKFEFKRIFSH